MIDTRTVSASIALLALGVQRRLERGTTDEEIDALVARYAEGHQLLFTVDTLEYLAKGGRIGRAAALAGSLLNVKPILTIRDGEVVPLKRVRGNQKAFAEFRELFEATTTDAPTLRVGIAHAAAPERSRRCARSSRTCVRRRRSRSSTTLGAVVGTHAGPGTVGFFWFDDRLRRSEGPSGCRVLYSVPVATMTRIARGFHRRGPGRDGHVRAAGPARAARRAGIETLPGVGAALAKRLRALGLADGRATCCCTGRAATSAPSTRSRSRSSGATRRSRSPASSGRPHAAASAAGARS